MLTICFLTMLMSGSIPEIDYSVPLRFPPSQFHAIKQKNSPSF